MFTGIIADIGEIVEVDTSSADHIYKIKTSFDMTRIAIGASIACAGCCLTVISKGENWFCVQVSAETVSKTLISEWQVGHHINLEKSLKMGDELGGHMVTGHIDGLTELVSLERVGDSHKLTFSIPEAHAKFFAPKGSIALDGISLTVNDVHKHTFTVNIIAHTWSVTTFENLSEGDRVHFEVDIMARYIQRSLEVEAA